MLIEPQTRQGRGASLKIRPFFLLAIACTVAWLAFVFLAPAGPTTETFVDIPSGTSTQAIADDLANAHTIRSRYAFLLLRAIEGRHLRAGEYRFDHPATISEVYSRLVKGDVYTRAVVIPEGFNLFDLAATVEAAGLGTKSQFLAAARAHTELIAQWSPRAPSLEGYLFPDTYRFSRHATPEQMLATMVRRFQQVATQAGLLNGKYDVARTVIIASLIEKEVAVDSERPLVAGVFTNRMVLHMPLQTDPSIVYAALLDGTWRGTIYRSDLDHPSPYNTYRQPGLPPGPIANPGLAALKAAMNPAKTDYLYFVADAQGHSRFSATLTGHQANVAAYRKAMSP